MKREVDGDELFDLETRGGGHAAGIAGAIALAAVVGLGVGLLAAPQTGERTRKALRKRLASIGEDIEEGFEEFEERSRPARKKLRKRAESLRDRGAKAWEEIEERLDDLEDGGNDRSSGVVGLISFAAGLAATYFLTSEQAAPTRAKVRDAASTLRDRASDKWDRFQERRHPNGGAAETKPKSEAHSGTGGAGA